jgi:hypothetical protein
MVALRTNKRLEEMMPCRDRELIWGSSADVLLGILEENGGKLCTLLKPLLLYNFASFGSLQS